MLDDGIFNAEPILNTKKICSNCGDGFNQPNGAKKAGNLTFKAFIYRAATFKIRDGTYI